MSQNLLSSGIIDPAQWPLARVWLEISSLLDIAPRHIEDLELWAAQIRVQIAGTKGRFVSYRRLPLWAESGVEAVQRCHDRVSLENLGELFRLDIQRYSHHYSTETIEQWRLVWKNRAEQLKIEALRSAREAERLRPVRERQQAYQRWQESWRYILTYCVSFESLERLAVELEAQSQEFEDFSSEQDVKQLWRQRWQELSQATA
ncbi:MAG: hypothetical protein ACFBSC_00755 [Microcoleaceae cyanobacterium]